MEKEDNEKVNYEEIEKLITSQIKEVRSILDDKYGIVVPRECDGFLERCLRLKDGKMEKTIKLIKTFHQTITDFKDWDVELQPSKFKEFYDKGFVLPLKNRDKEGRLGAIIQCKLWNPKVHNFDECIAVLWMASQSLNANNPEYQRYGFVMIFDFSNITMAQAWAIKQWRLIALAKWAQNGVAGRVKAVHLLFHPRIVSVIYAAIKPFLKEKFRKRILFHDSIESFYKHFDKQGLPTTLGGDLELYSPECYEKSLVDQCVGMDSFFKEMQSNLFPSK